MISQDEKIKAKLDAVARRHGYKQGVLDSEKGTITYETYNNLSRTHIDVLHSIQFRNELIDTVVCEEGEFNVTSHFGEVVVKLPDWERGNERD